MKNRNKTLYAIQRTDSYTPTSSSVIFNSVPQYAESLTCNPDTHGNFKSPNAQEYTKTVQNYLSGSLQIVNKLDGRNWQLTTGNFGPAPFRATSFTDSTAYNNCLSKLYEEYRGKLDLSVSLLQSGQAVDLFKPILSMARNGRRLDKHIEAFGRYLKENILTDTVYYTRRGKRYHRERRLDPLKDAKEIGKRWLEYQYGWKPLLSDIHDLALEMVRVPSQETLRIRATGHSREESSMTTAGTYADILTKWEVSRRCLMVVNFKPPDQSSNLARLSSLNPLSIGWELLPFSFVVDWFYDIGGYLRNAESSILSHNSFLNGYTTETCLSKGTSVCKGSKTIGNNIGTVSQQGSYVQSYKRRSVLGSSPWPRKPAFQTDLGAGRLLNAASLLSQLLKGH